MNSKMEQDLLFFLHIKAKIFLIRKCVKLKCAGMLSTNYTGKMDLLVKTKRCYVKTKRCYAFLFICVPICYHTSVDPLPSSPPTLSLEFFCRLHHQWQAWVAVLTGIASRFARYTASADRCAEYWSAKHVSSLWIKRRHSYSGQPVHCSKVANRFMILWKLLAVDNGIASYKFMQPSEIIFC